LIGITMWSPRLSGFFENIKAVLDAADAGFEDVVK